MVEVEISDAEFVAMLEKVKTREEDVKKLATDHKLAIYAHGKQGDIGDCNESKPGMLKVKEKFKWEAWTGLKGMDKQTGRRKFTELAKDFL